MDNLKLITPVLGEDKAKKVLKLANNYDKYMDKFRKEMNALINPVGLEVKTGLAFVEKADPVTAKK